MRPFLSNLFAAVGYITLAWAILSSRRAQRREDQREAQRHARYPIGDPHAWTPRKRG